MSPNCTKWRESLQKGLFDSHHRWVWGVLQDHPIGVSWWPQVWRFWSWRGLQGLGSMCSHGLYQLAYVQWNVHWFGGWNRKLGWSVGCSFRGSRRLYHPHQWNGDRSILILVHCSLACDLVNNQKINCIHYVCFQ